MYVMIPRKDVIHNLTKPYFPHSKLPKKKSFFMYCMIISIMGKSMSIYVATIFIFLFKPKKPIVMISNKNKKTRASHPILKYWFM